MRYASGARALGRCQRCGDRVRYLDLVDDKHTPGLRVCQDCFDIKHPAEKPFNADEGIILRKPSVDTDDDSTIIHSGTASAGGLNTITLAIGAPAFPSMYTGNTITLTGGAGSGQSRTIAGYEANTRVATVSSNWATTPDATSTYRITSSVLVTALSLTGNFGGST